MRERAGKQPEERILIEKVRRARPGVERATREAAKSKDFNCKRSPDKTGSGESDLGSHRMKGF